MRRITGGDRIRDVLALLVLLAGVGLFFYSRYRLTELGAGRFAPTPLGRPLIEQAIRWHRLANAGLWTAAVGCLVAVVSALWPRLRRAPARDAAAAVRSDTTS